MDKNTGDFQGSSFDFASGNFDNFFVEVDDDSVYVTGMSTLWVFAKEDLNTPHTSLALPQNPVSITLNSNYIFIMHANNGGISIISKSSLELLETINVTANYSGCFIEGENTLYAAVDSSIVIYNITDIGNIQILDTIPISGLVTNILTDSKNIYTTQTAAGTPLHIINKETKEVTTPDYGGGNIIGSNSFFQDERHLYITGILTESSLLFVRKSDFSRIATPTIPTYSSARSLATDGDRIVISSSSTGRRFVFPILRGKPEA